MFSSDSTPCHFGEFSVLQKTEVKQELLTIYPNPTPSLLFIKGVIPINSHYEIYDIYGKFIVSGSIKKQEIDVSNLTSGLYLLKNK